MTSVSTTATTQPRWSATGTKRGTVIAAVAGILFAVLSLARVPITGEVGLPTWEASTGEVVEFYQSLTFDTAFLVGMGMVTIGWLLLLVFIAKFSSIVGQADGGSPWLGRLIVGLAVVNVALTFPYLIAISTGARLADTSGVGADSFLLLHSVVNGVIWFALLTDALLWATVGVAVLITGAFPKWLAAAFLGTAVFDVVAFFGPFELWNVVGALVYLWTLLLAVVMLIRADRSSIEIAQPDLADR